ncbi:MULTISPECIES: competence type IV pilus major pilin ComGC [Neobacillus]|uniref:ComG operon protein 3 n=1 Tax=Neobacillus rhizophilus TaxID=2833579 RepID=A0A942YZ32_9BACI|nr:MULTISPECIES: competence type IV pilus major pilin ComGC [Neobacillus]MBS4215671.1 prepilin-type N-terminal cleavage/methylation domain-containing protein [Neobacillus rhizophilus]MBU8916432.1 prepilin-type N-terminal cleavage/methylation domain-containing protein [Bacillus sp. FJAT-29953]
MKNIKRNKQAGFTLIEMMIVMLVISVILIITIPNVARHNANIKTKGCEGFQKMVEAQVQAYEMEKNEPATIEKLKSAGYLKDAKGCPGKEVVIEADGTVTLKETETKTAADTSTN